jgi:hypothetical protein
MPIDFSATDVLHRIIARFVPSHLPSAKKPYHLKALGQSELDLHGIASKAPVYNIATDPKVIEDGMTAGFELIKYALADGFRIQTALFTLSIRIPGEYDGTETHLPGGVTPEVCIQPTALLQHYIEDLVQIAIAGRDTDQGHIGEAVDESTGHADETATVGRLLTIHGHGLKLKGDAAHGSTVGIFFETPDGTLFKADTVAVNKPRTLTVIVPPIPTPNTARLKVVTQSTVKSRGHTMKEPREVSAEFTLLVQ